MKLLTLSSLLLAACAAMAQSPNNENLPTNSSAGVAVKDAVKAEVKEEAKAKVTPQGLLTVHVAGANNNKGEIRVLIINSQQQFDSDDQAFATCAQAIITQQVACQFSAIPYGDYAIFTFHDENKDEQLNVNFFGIPTEKLAISRIDLAQNSEPNFAQSQIRFNSQHGQVFLNLQ
ncbi:DUF2141 domain-containing protein [Catenovulum sp. SM1970]|uniref:DUF2141 domain-containing protein n=1 Tax=Marinifaba aquimaris TaxID=2741323 RepID=UPI0015736D91|nr:DUF2141 domain-containing protein [Marinifaba aquimaris]NTS77513.1 DUF2141 domain-containing protein [Marinifaba aquimaris]